MMKTVKKVGVAGLGYMGKRHLAQYLALGYETCTADPRITATEALALGSSAHYESIEEMLEKDGPHAVSVCLPTYLHKAGALAAFSYGADVLLEKPFALKLDDIDDMIDTAKASDCRIMVAHICRFAPQYLIAKEYIDNRRLGNPIFMNAWRFSATPNWSVQNWLGDRNASGGTIMDLQIHEIDLARWFLGPVKETTSIQRQGTKRKGSGFFHVVSNLSFENGAAAVLEAGHLMPEGYPLTSGYQIVMEDGTLEFIMRGTQASMTLFMKDRSTDMTCEYLEKYDGRDLLLHEIEHFIRSIESGNEFCITSAEARESVNTALRILGNEILTM